ncbi:hypothetical protein Ahy_B03g062007 [Arachis hypogaea]|uniref:Uncharacterized protein n=1 Tax=Arachis hypogaea TaxID=3818 RepID=A0A444ZSV3_ARAHY|nr:hypothetical protein Ahy_B03g062007 [Arachis hypogaea]
MTIATLNGYHNLVVESDLATAISFINHGCSPGHHSARLQQVSWIHVPREANMVADQLAKKGQELSLGLHLFDTAPPDIKFTLLCDCIGTLDLGELSSFAFLFVFLFLCWGV